MSEAIDILRWIFGGAAVALGSLISLGNWVTLIGAIVTKTSSSFVPLIGGVLVAVGLVILPIEGLWKLAWIGLLADFGTVPLWTWAGISGFFDKINNKKPNRVGRGI